jgi:hypothetical protein
LLLAVLQAAADSLPHLLLLLLLLLLLVEWP